MARKLPQSAPTVAGAVAPAPTPAGLNRVAARAFDVVLRAGPLSRSQLRANLRVSPSTLTATVQELVERGLVAEVGHAPSTGGRPAGLLDLAPHLGGVLAADIGGINLRVAVGDCRGTLRDLHTLSTATAVSGKTLQGAVLEALQDAAARCQGPVRAVAISVAGIVDPETGAISRADHIPGWDEADDLSWIDRFDVPVVIDNEANLGALGEHRATGRHDLENMLFVAVGAGVGAGLVLDGKLYRGASGAAGELGLLRRGGPRDSIELERVAAAAAIVDRYAANGGEAVATAEEVFSRAEAGDRLAAAAVEDAADELALGIANAIILFNPRVVVIGGGLGAAGAQLLAPLKARLAPLVPEMPEIGTGSLGSEAAIVGAVHWAAQVAQRELTLGSTESPSLAFGR